ncbi:adenylate/guanylate cyclase domain-containing protein [Roseibium salinum]|nr:adenylate/guanylate cyclase domain-containing protein [Roseibium salinum]
MQEPGGEGNARLSCSIGIAFGEVTYGNVGSKERLDFTVIGSAANIAARLGDHGKAQGHAVVTTREVAEVAGCAAEALGAVRLHNVTEPVEAYAISPLCRPQDADR